MMTLYMKLVYLDGRQLCRWLLKSLLFWGASCFFVARSQEPVTSAYTGAQGFRVGEAVEASYAGTWTKAQVVGVDEQGGRYKIHFEGEKYCNGHVLDTWIARQWVRPAKQAPSASGPANASAPAQAARRGVPVVRGKSGEGMFKAGEQVLYSNTGVLWLEGATIESYDPEKRTYQLRLPGGSGDIVPCHSVSRRGVTHHSFFVGQWDVRVSGATSTFEKDGDLYRRFSGGAQVAPLEIKADGTYVWRSGKKQVRGQWKARDGVPGITLLKAIDGKDWTLYEKTEGYAPTATTRDEIGFHHLPSQSGYYVAYRLGPNKSCVLAGRTFSK